MSASEILDLWSGEDTPDLAALVTPAVYEQMRRLAHRELRSRRSGATLGTTALVHEVFVKLAERGGFVDEQAEREPGENRAVDVLALKRSTWRSPSPAAWRTPTAPASPTATSSRRTSCSPRTAASRCSTSASPSSTTRRG